MAVAASPRGTAERHAAIWGSDVANPVTYSQVKHCEYLRASGGVQSMREREKLGLSYSKQSLRKFC